MIYQRKTRRSLLRTMAASVAGAVVASSARAAGLTPSATEGPFYPTPAMRFKDVDNDLVKIAGLVREAGGEVITLGGTITDKAGTPLAGHRIEIWQCDMNGKYLHPGDNRDLAYDQGFQGFGHDITDENGRYVFRTIKPTRYPGRTPHIHVKVFDGNRELLTTQFYLAGEPENERDGLYRRMSAKQAKSVLMRFDQGADGPETTVNVVV